MENNKIEKLETRLLTHTENPIKAMWLAARNCYYRPGLDDLECQYDEDKAINLLGRIYKKGHLSIFEQASFQFGIEGASRSLLAQLTRHRIGWSYAVQSQHYQDHTDFHFKDLEQYLSDEHKQSYYDLMDKINNFYTESIQQGLPRYIAREVLPNSTSVHMVVSANLSALNHFWELRLGPENTPEIRKLAMQLYDETKKVIPRLNEILPQKVEY